MCPQVVSIGVIRDKHLTSRSIWWRQLADVLHTIRTWFLLHTPTQYFNTGSGSCCTRTSYSATKWRGRPPAWPPPWPPTWPPAWPRRAWCSPAGAAPACAASGVTRPSSRGRRREAWWTQYAEKYREQSDPSSIIVKHCCDRKIFYCCYLFEVLYLCVHSWIIKLYCFFILAVSAACVYSWCRLGAVWPCFTGTWSPANMRCHLVAGPGQRGVYRHSEHSLTKSTQSTDCIGGFLHLQISKLYIKIINENGGLLS